IRNHSGKFTNKIEDLKLLIPSLNYKCENLRLNLFILLNMDINIDIYHNEEFLSNIKLSLEKRNDLFSIIEELADKRELTLYPNGRPRNKKKRNKKKRNKK